MTLLHPTDDCTSIVSHCAANQCLPFNYRKLTLSIIAQELLNGRIRATMPGTAQEGNRSGMSGPASPTSSAPSWRGPLPVIP